MNKAKNGLQSKDKISNLTSTKEASTQTEEPPEISKNYKKSYIIKKR